MASSVLGKRARSSADAGPDSTTLRAKRRATITIFNDGNEDTVVPPQVRAQGRTRGRDAESMEVDELADVSSIKFASSYNSNSSGRPTLSPTKIKTHFKTAKNGSIDENSKAFQLPTPKTPSKRRDALSKFTPATPRHRVMVTAKALTPRTPRTPSTPGSSVNTVYNAARQLFARSAEPGKLIGREEERSELAKFINTCIDTTSGGCTYVSGPPGTGKSALVHEISSVIPESDTVKKAYINCMSVKTSKDIYTALLQSLSCDSTVLEGSEMKTLQSMFIPRKRSSTIYILTLDEIDHVLTLDLEFMYCLFEWSLQKSSRLVLIGIANALDLTDRFLPRLKAKNLRPHLLPFLPYSAAQIREVITIRLKSLLPADVAAPGFVPFLHPAAIDLCARKVSGQTGDLRKAFDICRRAIELIEIETKQKYRQSPDEQVINSPSKKPLGENINLSSPIMPSPTEQSPSKTLVQCLAKLTVETAPRALITHVNKITSSTLGNGTSQRLKTLNLQQKAALCALVALEKRKRVVASNVMATPSKFSTVAPTVKTLYDAYCMLCKRDSVLHPLTSTEFRDVIGSLETLSLISAVDRKTGSFVGLNTPSKRGRRPGFGGGVGIGDEKRVGSCVGERELQQTAEGSGASILSSILSGDGLD